MERYRQREVFIRFSRYTRGMDLFPFLYYTNVDFYFDCSKYLDWCECHGIEDEESIEEFNIRHFGRYGKRLNKLIEEMI